MISVLEFNELDDFLAHLREEEQTDWTHLEIAHITSERDQHGIRAVAFFAVATRRFFTPAPYLVVWSCALLNTTSVHIQMDKHETPEHQTRSQLHANFDKVKQLLQERGLMMRPGKWSTQPPEYLR